MEARRGGGPHVFLATLRTVLGTGMVLPSLLVTRRAQELEGAMALGPFPLPPSALQERSKGSDVMTREEVKTGISCSLLTYFCVYLFLRKGKG